MALSENISAVEWCRVDISSYAIRDVGDGLVVYHRPSGKTHLLNEASYRLVAEILKEPRDLNAIALEFEPGEGSPSHQEYLESLAEMLLRLEQFGLIERAR